MRRALRHGHPLPAEDVSGRSVEWRATSRPWHSGGRSFSSTVAHSESCSPPCPSSRPSRRREPTCRSFDACAASVTRRCDAETSVCSWSGPMRCASRRPSRDANRRPTSSTDSSRTNRVVARYAERLARSQRYATPPPSHVGISAKRYESSSQGRSASIAARMCGIDSTSVAASAPSSREESAHAR